MTRLLGIDHGKVRLGLAVSDPERRIASPLVNYTRHGLEQDGRYLKSIIAGEDIGKLVIGLPVHLAGHEGGQARAAREFGNWLIELTGLPCVFWDERFSTWEAETALWEAGLTHKQRKARRDQVAAQVLLQAYIDAGCPEEPRPGPIDG
jgi:putative Holliday junction resolvase